MQQVWKIMINFIVTQVFQEQIVTFRFHSDFRYRFTLFKSVPPFYFGPLYQTAALFTSLDHFTFWITGKVSLCIFPLVAIQQQCAEARVMLVPFTR